MMSPAITIVNRSKGELQFANIKSSDDTPWVINPKLPAVLMEGNFLEISHPQEPIQPPKSMNFAITFTDSEMDLGTIAFIQPIVGTHSFECTGPFNFDISSPSVSHYVVVITSK